MADLRFPGASARYVRLRKDGVRFAARQDDSPFSMWWHFALDDPPPPHVDCIWEHTEEVLGHSSLPAAVPVYRCEGRWRRVPVRSCRYNPERHEFRFRVPTGGGRVEIAFCYPYEMERVEALLAQLGRRGAVSVRTIGESERGRPFRLIEMGHGDRHVWLTARHHAGEVPGSHVLEGLLRRAARWPELLARVTIHATPVMDVDGVAEGMYGKDRAPRDFNRDYVAAPCRPEVAALMAAAQAVGEANLFLDLHAPTARDGSYLVPISEPLAAKSQWAEAGEFARVLEALAPRSCPVRVADMPPGALNWYGDLILQCSTDFFRAQFGALAMTLETSYHRSWHGRLVSPTGWQALGRALLEVVAVREGLRPPPGVSQIAPPAPLVPRLDHWSCVGWPQDIELRERLRSLELRGWGEGGSAAVMARKLRPGGPAEFSYRLNGEVANMTAVVKGFDRASGRPTGAFERATLQPKATGGWQAVSVPHRQGEYRLLFRIGGLKGELDIRTG